MGPSPQASVLSCKTLVPCVLPCEQVKHRCHCADEAVCGTEAAMVERLAGEGLLTPNNGTKPPGVCSVLQNVSALCAALRAGRSAVRRGGRGGVRRGGGDGGAPGRRGPADAQQWDQAPRRLFCPAKR